jgi:hypothetical protein
MSPEPSAASGQKRLFSPKNLLGYVLDHGVKPVLVIVLCVAGLIFEFLLELPFIFIIGFHRMFGRRGR